MSCDFSYAVLGYVSFGLLVMYFILGVLVGSLYWIIKERRDMNKSL